MESTIPQVEPLPEIHIGDPLYRFFHDRLKLRLAHVMTVYVLFSVIRVILIPYFHHRALGISFFAALEIKDVQSLLVSFITHPAILYVYWTTVDQIPAAFKMLHENRVSRPRTGMTASEFLRALERQMTAKSYNLAILVVVILVIVFFQRLGWSTHRTQGIFGAYPYNDFQQYGIETVYGFFRFWFVGWALYRILVTIDFLRLWWANFEAEVIPMHPDQAGGFASIGGITLQTGLLLGAMSIFLILTILTEVQRAGYLEILILSLMVILLIALIPLTLFGPIWTTHKAMVKSRRRMLAMISEQFEARWDAIYSGRMQPGPDQIEQLEGYEKLHTMTLKMIPVWPLAGGDLRRFGVALAPVWTFLVTIIAETVFPWLFGSTLVLP